MVVYEDLLSRDVDWALREGSMHFEEQSAVHKTLRRITQRLDELGIPYALVGGMALFFHGYRRFTEDIEILVSREGFQEVNRQLEGRGYVPPVTGSQQLRDAETGVRIEFLVTGEYPGDGKPKPVAFPDPAEAPVVEAHGIRLLALPRLIELKLASGMTNPGRVRDLADVQDLMKLLHLPADLADQLDPYVRAKYRELWDAVQDNPREP
jgi:hypothetical protein